MFGVLLTGSGLGLAFGVLMIMAGAMSDAPAEGDATAKGGFFLAVASVIVCVVTLVAKFKGLL